MFCIVLIWLMCILDSLVLDVTMMRGLQEHYLIRLFLFLNHRVEMVEPFCFHTQ